MKRRLSEGYQNQEEERGGERDRGREGEGREGEGEREGGRG